jgi:Tfp pilus assembly protein FimT
MNRGITLVEVAVVLSIIVVLGFLAGVSYEDWMKRYRIEKVTKELYSDLMHARELSIVGSRRYYAVLEDKSYSIVEDTDDDGSASAADIALPSFPRNTEFFLKKNNGTKPIFFDQKGAISTSRTIWFGTNNDAADKSATGADYDCMKVSVVRIIMGHLDGNGCVPL